MLELKGFTLATRKAEIPPGFGSSRSSERLPSEKFRSLTLHLLPHSRRRGPRGVGATPYTTIPKEELFMYLNRVSLIGFTDSNLEH
jgi:hypothetical protein